MHKDEILQMLLSRSGAFVSGQQISKMLGVSRAAVSKSIHLLIREGYHIESRTRAGYRLLSSPDRLGLSSIKANLSPAFADIPLTVLTEVDSTNIVARRLAVDGAPHGTCVVAEKQTMGRGRFARSFYSPPGSGIYLSMVLRPGLPVQKLMVLTAFTASAVCDAIEQVGGFRPRIKWTNDLIFGKQKLCGISTETAVESETGLVHYAVVGIGINVNQRRDEFPPELRGVATSLSEASGKKLPRNALAAAVIDSLLRMCGEGLLAGRQRWLEKYRADCMTVGCEVRVVHGDTERKGTAVGIDENAALIVHYDGGQTETVNAGEVSVRGMYGYV